METSVLVISVCGSDSIPITHHNPNPIFRSVFFLSSLGLLIGLFNFAMLVHGYGTRGYIGEGGCNQAEIGQGSQGKGSCRHRQGEGYQVHSRRHHVWILFSYVNQTIFYPFNFNAINIYRPFCNSIPLLCLHFCFIITPLTKCS